jgi:MFS transporter, BCD family, chlorophyll transporter
VLTDPTLAYAFVYHVEIALLFVTIIALGPLVRISFYNHNPKSVQGLSLPEFPT